MIELVEGRGVGSGKSYMVLTRLLPHWGKGGTACVSDTVEIKWDACVEYAKRKWGVVLEADQYRSISAEHMQSLHQHTPGGTAALPVLIVVDEAQDAFNARDWSDKAKRPFFSWLCQSRHDDNDVMIISQAVANVDKQVRRLATYIWITRNTEFFPVMGSTLAKLIRSLTFGLSDGKFFRVTQLDQDGRTALGKRWVKADKGLFGCYESKAMRGKHPRLGEAVAVKKLATVQKAKIPMKYILLLLVALVVWGAYKAFGRGNPMRPKLHEETSGIVHGGSPAPAAAKGGTYAIERVTYLGSYTDLLCTVELGNLRVGQMSGLGMVEFVSGPRARIRTPQETIVFVVADKILPAFPPDGPPHPL